MLVREDGTYLYTFTSVVDDVDFGVTHVIRGEDHVANTGVQIQLFEALGARAPPAFAHHNLLVGADGQALSKRLGSLSIRSFREEGLEPLAVLSHSATIGTRTRLRPIRVCTHLRVFHFDKLSRAPARFDIEELNRSMPGCCKSLIMMRFPAGSKRPGLAEARHSGMRCAANLQQNL